MQRGPFVRYRELPEGRVPTAPQPLAETGQFRPWIKNLTGGPLERWSVLRISGSAVTPDDDADQYQSSITLLGAAPDQDDQEEFGILWQHLESNAAGPLILSGETFARLIGPAGQTHCGPREGLHTLTAGSGPCAILYDPGEPAGDPEGERIAIVRIGAGAGVCDEVDEFWIEGVPTSGAGKIGYTLDRDPDAAPAAVYEELVFDYNETAASFQTQLLTHDIGDLTTADVEVFGGPWPNVSIYVRWKGDFGKRAIEFPSLSPDTLNNGAVIKMRKASAANWSGY